MNAFDQVVASLLEREGFWVRSCVKVDLTKEEKRAIGRYSSPRWELDLVAYKGQTNQLWIVECKSYLDLGGVAITAFDGSNETFAGRFKLFNDSTLFRIVSRRLCCQLVESGACAAAPSVALVLAAGRIANDKHREQLRRLFEQRGWILWDESALRTRLRRLSDESYDNAVASVVSKLLLRESKSRTRAPEEEPALG